MSRHLSTRNISSKSMHAFLLTDRQTNKQMNTGKTFTSSFVGGIDIFTAMVQRTPRVSAAGYVWSTYKKPYMAHFVDTVNVIMT